MLDAELPRVRLTTTIRPDAVEIGYEQLGEVFDLPVTITLQYADGTSEDVVVALTEASGTAVVPARGPSAAWTSTATTPPSAPSSAAEL